MISSINDLPGNSSMRKSFRTDELPRQFICKAIHHVHHRNITVLLLDLKFVSLISLWGREIVYVSVELIRLDHLGLARHHAKASPWNAMYV